MSAFLERRRNAPDARTLVLSEVSDERAAQDAKWGEQNHPDGTGRADDQWVAEATRDRCDTAFRQGKGTWRLILNEEVAEAYAETDPDRLRAELLQVAAVAVAWVESIDRRASDASPTS